AETVEGDGQLSVGKVVGVGEESTAGRRDDALIVQAPGEYLALLARKCDLEALAGPDAPLLFFSPIRQDTAEIPAVASVEYGEREDKLSAVEGDAISDDTLAQRPLADDQSPAAILEAGGDQLTPESRRSIDEANHRDSP